MSAIFAEIMELEAERQRLHQDFDSSDPRVGVRLRQIANRLAELWPQRRQELAGTPQRLKDWPPVQRSNQ